MRSRLLGGLILLTGLAGACLGRCPHCWGLAAPCEVCGSPRKRWWGRFREEVAWTLADVKKGGGE